MTREELDEFVAASRAAQGLGPKVTDPVIVEMVATLLRADRDG